MNKQLPLVVAIAGPTATGKSDAAVSLCQALGGEVISMDSMQVYRGFTIGTAKPSLREMGGIPHHLMSMIPPDASYSVAEYQRDAQRVMDDLLSQRKLPVFVGGTGLYLQAVSHPLSFTGAGGTDTIRTQLQQEAEQPGGPQRLHMRLAVVDPLSAQRLHANNTRRIIRALEVYMVTGVPMSEQIHEWEAEPEQDWLIFAIDGPREMLYDRINRRVDKMISAGLVDEVQGLLQAGVPKDAQAMQAIGYKEVVASLAGESTLAEAIEAIKMNTRRYAKRQLTWLRRDKRIRWLDLSQFKSEMPLHREMIEQVQRYQEARHAVD